MTASPFKPKLVPPSPPSPEETAPDLSYEYRQRQHIATRDWGRVHVAGDQAPALPWSWWLRRLGR